MKRLIVYVVRILIRVSIVKNYILTINQKLEFYVKISNDKDSYLKMQ
ncbi:hypothetical protein [Clostridium botulinum]|nr:hypothetical protein [Clostridium botulinum]